MAKNLDFMRFGGYVLPDKAILEALSQEVFSMRTYSYGSKELEQEFKEKFAFYVSKQYGAQIEEKDIIITSGTKQALSYTILALTKPKDYILIPTPAYPTYEEISLFSKLNVVKYDILKENIAQNIIKNILHIKPKILILNFPHSPTGITLNQEEYLKILICAEEHDTIIVHDIVFCDYLYKGSFSSLLSHHKNNILEYYSFSKSHFLSGLRIGGVYGDFKLIKNLRECRDILDYPVSTFAQKGALLSMDYHLEHAFTGEKEAAQKKINMIMNGFDMLNIKYVTPQGGVCLFAESPDWSENKFNFSKELFYGLGIKVFPGVKYGKSYENYFRITVMPPLEDVKDFLIRLSLYEQYRTKGSPIPQRCCE